MTSKGALPSNPNNAVKLGDSMSSASESEAPKTYPIGSYYKILEGFDIHKSKRIWEAVLVVKDDEGKTHLRLYKWVNKEEKGWKVDLARFDIGYWELGEVFEKIRNLKTKYGI
jgi:hypothetical protein